MGVTNASVCQRLTNRAYQTYNDLGQKVTSFYSRAAENDRLTSTLVSLDPYRGGFSREWYSSSNPRWLKPVVVTGALLSFGASTFKIFQSPWRAKPLWMRRILGPLFVLPIVYFAGYGIYTLFRKGIEWNKARLEKKAQAEFNKAQRKIEAEYDKEFVAIRELSLEKQYEAIEALRKKMDKPDVNWLTKDGKSYVQLLFEKDKQAYTYEREVAADLYAEHTKVEAEKKRDEMFKKIAEGLQAINPNLMDESTTKDEAIGLIGGILGPHKDSLQGKLFTVKTKNGLSYLILLKDGKEYYEQQIAAQIQKELNAEDQRGVPLIEQFVDYVFGRTNDIVMGASAFFKVEKN